MDLGWIGLALLPGLVIYFIAQSDQLLQAERRLSRIKGEVDTLSPSVIEQAAPALREQLQAALLLRIKTLTRFGHAILRILQSGDLGTGDRQLRALKVLPELLAVLIDARAKYRAITSTEAPGGETLEALKPLMAQGPDSSRPAPAV